MRNANILSRLTGKQLYLWIACGVCGVVSLLLMGILMGLERNGEWGMLYFPGCALFINGVFLILPTAWVLATSYFSGLAIKVPAVYAAVTGVLYHCTRVGLVAGIVLAVLGLIALWAVRLEEEKLLDKGLKNGLAEELASPFFVCDSDRLQDTSRRQLRSSWLSSAERDC